jgi:5-methylcytosine-specific restriction endonuclease McrA
MQSVARVAERSPNTLRTLVLNADHSPLATWPLSLISAQDAVHALMRDRAYSVEDWPGAFFHSPSTQLPVPKVIALRQYAPVNGAPKFCRRSILLRDRYACQYCGERFEASDLTFDHLVARSEGGRTTWENILTACLRCNGLKGNKHANHSGRRGVVHAHGRLRPLKMPRQPTAAELLRNGLEFLPNDVREDFGSYLYWNVPLET